MKQFLLPALVLSALPALAATPAEVQTGNPDFRCFPYGAAISSEHIPASALRPATRVDKLGNSKWDNTDGHDLREIQAEGKLRIPVILVNYADTKFTVGNGDPHTLINDMLNGENFTYEGATGSANAFYRTVSWGQFDPQYDVLGPVTVSGPSADYCSVSTSIFQTDAEGNQILSGGKPVGVYTPGLMVEEAIRALDGTVDFSQYDSNGDGVVDFVYLFFAGRGATTGGGSNTIHPHAYTLTAALGHSIEADGVQVNRYCTSAELGSNGKLSGIGTFCHEFGHVLGLPDLYRTDSQSTAALGITPGTFDCMDGGNYNNDEHTPPMFSGYEMYALEWAKPVELQANGSITMLPLSARPLSYKVSTRKPQEYFMFETRAPFGPDYYLEGHGLLAWHIDFNLDTWQNNAVNNNVNHQRIDLEEADGTNDLASRSGDPFPGVKGNHEFLGFGSPSFLNWDGDPVGFDIEHIVRHPDGCVSFRTVSDADVIFAEAEIAPAVAEVTEAGSTTATLKWSEVEGAESYMVSVYDLAEFDGVLIKDYVDGFGFRSVGKDTSVEITGLEPGHNYGAYVYALNEVNASRPDAPVEFRTVGGSSFADTRTNVYAHADNGIVTLNWDNVPDADRYELTVALPAATEETASEVATFDNNGLPAGWNSDARYESKNNYYGDAAPSMRFEVANQQLTVGSAANEIREISFWSRTVYDDPCSLTIYGIGKDGSKKIAAVISDLPQKGETRTVALPAGCYGLQFVYSTSVSGQIAYIDDLRISRHAGFEYTPAAGADIEYLGTSAAAVKGLEADKTYAAFVIPYKGGEAGERSNVTLFVPSKALSGVDEIDGIEAKPTFTTEGNSIVCDNPDADFSIYTTSGICIARNIRGSVVLPQKGVYVVSCGNLRMKVIF